MAKARTSKSHPILVDYLADEDAPFRGRIGMTFAPGKQHVGATAVWARDLDADAAVLADREFTHVLVSLVEDHEISDLKIDGLVAAFEKLSVQVVRVPFADGGVPTMEAAKNAVTTILDAAVNRRRNVVVHCKGGLGRTGLIVACALVATGLDAASAVAAVRKVRTGAIENPTQEQFVSDFAGDGFRFVADPALPSRPSLSSIRGCLLGGAIGDALGYPIEFEGPGAKLAKKHGVKPPPSLGFANGERYFSDDTQMTLFVAEGLIRANQRFIDTGMFSVDGAIKRALIRWLATQEKVRSAFKDESVTNGWLFSQPALHALRAPGNTCLGALRIHACEKQRAASGVAINSSKGCGAVMRSAPIGLAFDEVADAFKCARDTGRYTHGHPSGYLSAAYFAAVIFGVSRGQALLDSMRIADGLLATETGNEEMVAILQRVSVLAKDGPPTIAAIEAIGGGWVGEEALAIALVCALTAERSERGFAEALWRSVLHGGDSDSTGSLTGNLLGALWGEDLLPEAWLPEVEMRDGIDRLARDFFSSVSLGRLLDLGAYPPN